MVAPLREQLQEPKHLRKNTVPVITRDRVIR